MLRMLEGRRASPFHCSYCPPTDDCIAMIFYFPRRRNLLVRIGAQSDPSIHDTVCGVAAIWPTRWIRHRKCRATGRGSQILIHSRPASLVAGTAMKTGPSEKLAGHFISKDRLLPIGRPLSRIPRSARWSGTWSFFGGGPRVHPPLSSNEFYVGRL